MAQANGTSEVAPQATELDQFLTALKPLIIQYVHENFEDDTPVTLGLTPEQIIQNMDLELNEKGVGFEGAMEMIKQTLEYSVRTGNPRFFDKLYCGAEPIGISSELITTVLNTNIHIFRVSPVFSVMELRLIKEAGLKFGFQDCDGITCPGGTYSNMIGLLCARNSMFPHTKMEGVSREEKLVILTSAEGHYSIAKSANCLGLGLNNVVKVPTTLYGEIIPSELERIVTELKAEGKKPFFVNATAGTTVKGGFDPMNAIADVAQKHGLWFHIDACWGGSVVFSRKHRHLMDGCERADSIAWNPHKMLGIPLQMSMLFMKKRGILQQSNALGATYLFRGSEYDLGDKTLQCGRKPDAFKLFMTWKYLGTEGLESRIDTAFENAAKFAEMIKKRPDEFELSSEPRGLNICFWYNPGWVRKIEGAEKVKATLTDLTAKISRKVNSRGKVLLEYSPNTHGGEFFRMVVNSPTIRDSDLALVLDEIALAGKGLVNEMEKSFAG